MLRHDVLKKVIKTDRKQESHIRITNEILKSPEWGSFILSKEAAIWFYLCGWIVRGEMNTAGLAHKLYRDYYLKDRKLVARWNQEQIAEHFSFKSKGYVSRLLRRLEEDWKAVKTIKIPSYSSYRMNLYEFGYVNKYGDDVFYLMENIFKGIANRKLARFQLAEEPIPENFLPVS